MHAKVLVYQGFQKRVLVVCQVALPDEHLTKRSVSLSHPGVDRRGECVASHEIHLRRQDAEQKVTIGLKHDASRGDRERTRRLPYERDRWRRKSPSNRVAMPLAEGLD